MASGLGLFSNTRSASNEDYQILEGISEDDKSVRAKQSMSSPATSEKNVSMCAKLSATSPGISEWGLSVCTRLSVASSAGPPCETPACINYRMSLIAREITEKRPYIFRTVGPRSVLADFGIIFKPPEPGFVFPGAVARNSSSWDSSNAGTMSQTLMRLGNRMMRKGGNAGPSMGKATPPPARSGQGMKNSISMLGPSGSADDSNDDFLDSDDSEDEQHRIPDTVFRAAKKSTRADLFVSHVWSAPRWQKALALSYYLNVRRATALAVLTWLCIAIGLTGHFGVDQMGGKAFLLPCLVYVPMAVFAVTFFCGHWLLDGRTLWLDKMCIHQSRGKLKELGVTALPEFVANSERLCILWCDEYFERLWCNAEVATFCAINQGADNVDVQPLWLAPWVFATLTCGLLSISIADRLFELIPIFGDYLARRLPDYPAVAVFLMQFFGNSTAFWISYMPATIPNWLSFSTKMHNHACMIRQTEEFRLDEAKCTVESDRPLVTRHIKQLFKAVPDLGKEADSWEEPDTITRFEHFIQQDFKYQIADRVGVDDSLNYPLALLVNLPMLFDSIANTLGCDGMPCDLSSVRQGCASVRQCMLTSSLCWTVGCLFIYPTTYPVMLGLIKMVTKHFTGWRSNIVGVLCAMIAYFYMACCKGSVSGLVLNAVVSPHWQWKLALAVVLDMVLVWNSWLFRLPTLPLVVFFGCFMGSVLCLSAVC